MNSVSKFVIDARPLNGNKNGVSRYVLGLINELRKNKNLIIILISNNNIIYAAAESDNVFIYEDQKFWSRIPGTLWLQIRSNHICKKFSADFFLGTQHIIPLLTNRKVHKSVIFHDLVYIKHPETMLRTNLVISKLLCGFSLKYSDKVFCVSNTTMNDISKIYKIPAKKMSVIYPGMPDKTFGIPSNKKNKSVFRFVVVGSLEPRKNITKLLECYFKLREINNDVRLTIVYGHKWGGASAVDSKIFNRALNDSTIEIKYSISDVDLISSYTESDALIFPSIYEGFGLPILEALTHTQIILNDIPIFREISTYIDNIRFIDFSKPSDDVASNLNSITLGNQGIAKINSSGIAAFSWKESCDKLLKSIGIMQ